MVNKACYFKNEINRLIFIKEQQEQLQPAAKIHVVMKIWIKQFFFPYSKRLNAKKNLFDVKSPCEYHFFYHWFASLIKLFRMTATKFPFWVKAAHIAC